MEEKEVEAPIEKNEEPSDSAPIAEAILAGGAAIAVGTIAAEVLSKDPEPVTDKTIVEEPESLPNVAEEPDVETSPTSSKESRHRHRSSRHSRSHQSPPKDKDSPPSTRDSRRDSHRPERPESHRKRRESDSSGKGFAFFTQTPPKKPTRHDSAISAGSSSSHGRHRKDRTPEEQADHDARKAARRAAKRALEDSEKANKGVPSDSAVFEDLPGDVPISAVPHRHSSRRQNSAKTGSQGSYESDKPKKLLDLKGESVVKSPFMVDDKPHYREEKVKSASKEKGPIMERPRFSFDNERPKLVERTTSTKEHKHRSHRHRDERAEESKEKHRVEEEREARKARKEAEKQMEIARTQVAEDARRQREKDEDERRLRREERRRKREELEKLSEQSEKIKDRSVGDRERPRERERRHRHRYEKKEEKPKGAFSSLFSAVKKVFD